MTIVRSTLADEARDDLASLSRANRAFAERHHGCASARQPVHTVYGGAHLFRADVARRLGDRALQSMAAYTEGPFELARALGLPGHASLPARAGPDPDLARRFEDSPEAVRDESRALWLALSVHARVLDKLRREPVEDYRIDFEDGYGVRPDDEEDLAALAAARETARGMREGTLPPFLGIRIKPLDEEQKLRAVRTLDLFVTTLVEDAGRLPDGFVVTLPKVAVPEQVATLAALLDRLERRLGLHHGALRLEIMVELAPALLAPDGRLVLPLLLDAARGRCTGAHFGTYDYTASCDVTAAWQSMDHPACELALQLMKIAFAGTGVFLSDGATTLLPVPPHRPGPGRVLSPDEERENRALVHRALRAAYENTQRSLRRGIYQGWDLHPAQLPARYAACYAFFLEGFDAAAERLRTFIDRAAQATLAGGVFDDAATGQGLLNYFLRALACGAVSLDEVAKAGLSVDEIRTRSFVRIVDGRRMAPGSRRPSRAP